MSRLMFAALTSVVLISSSRAAAQRVAGRELLDFPIGLLADPPALGREMGGGLWNPASALLRSPTRMSFGFAGLTTPQELGVHLEMLEASYSLRPNFTGSVSFAQAAVSDILRTDTDPQSLGGEIPYGTTVASVGGATAFRHAVVGVAARYRWGSADRDRSSQLAIDGGVVIDSVAGSPFRLAGSTFLFSPSSASNEASYFAAVDAPVLQLDSALMVRAGFSITHTESGGSENYAFGTARYRQLDFSSGLSTVHEFGNSSQRWRMGLGLHRAGYTVAIGRENGGAGFGASYQFLLTRAVK